MINIKNWLLSDGTIFFVYRVSSVIFIQTSYVPDEYWQSLEVAHKMVFGYGYLTWEWKNGLRSSIYPSIFAVIFKVLKYMGLDSPSALKVIPRLVQAFLTALSDTYFLHFCKNIGCKTFWAKTFLITNWFWYFCGSRTLLNMFETSLTIIAMYYYPWNILKETFTKTGGKSSEHQWALVKSQSWKYLSIVVLNCIIRPTAVTIWGPLVVYQLMRLCAARVKDFILFTALPITSLLSLFSVSIDYYWYGKFIFPPYNFFVSNVYFGIASFYGSHPAHWYITQGVPVVLGLHLIPFGAGFYSLSKNLMKPSLDKFEKVCVILMAVILLNIMIFSMIPHKEFRFILPLLPMMEIIAIKFMSDWNRLNSKKEWSSRLTTILIIGFIGPAALFGVFHQRGTLTVMNYLSETALKQPDNTSLLFLTPCHSTPLYSHLHVDVPARFIACDPPLTSRDTDESEEFFKSPLAWLEDNWTTLGGPSHVVLFDSVQSYIDNFLTDKGFVLKKKFLHTVFSGSSAGDYILVYER